MRQKDQNPNQYGGLLPEITVTTRVDPITGETFLSFDDMTIEFLAFALGFDPFERQHRLYIFSSPKTKKEHFKRFSLLEYLVLNRGNFELYMSFARKLSEITGAPVIICRKWLDDILRIAMETGARI